MYWRGLDMKYKQLRLGDLAEFTTGKLNANKAVEDGKYPFFTTSPETLRINNFAFDQDAILLGGNNANGVFQLKRYTGKFNAYQRTYVISVVKENIINNDYLYYALMPKLVELQNKSLGTATKFITKRILENLLIKVPNNYNEMERRATYLRTIDNKIQLNKQLNANLLELSKTLFIKKFGNTNGDKHIKDYLSPKRGKNLLKKNVVKGSIPVIAGGLHPAAYHNKSNTGSPVITISASGANAGFVNIWLNRVWSSDSSFIDPSVTDNVYFWYLLLKNRQKEIFDSQTGSAQPHIYPKHIENMPVRKFDNDLIAEFNGLVTPIFENIGANLVERRNLNQIKNELLNKLF